MTRRVLLDAAARGGRKAKAGTLDVCERHVSEHPNRCEGRVYEASGDEARAIADQNELCRACRLPLARVLDRIKAIEEDRGCSFCFEKGVTVAVAARGFLGIPMEICEGCASDAVAALRKARGAEDEDEDGDQVDDGE